MDRAFESIKGAVIYLSLLIQTKPYLILLSTLWSEWLHFQYDYIFSMILNMILEYLNPKFFCLINCLIIILQDSKIESSRSCNWFPINNHFWENIPRNKIILTEWIYGEHLLCKALAWNKITIVITFQMTCISKK